MLCHSKVKAKALALTNGFHNSSFQLQCPDLHVAEVKQGLKLFQVILKATKGNIHSQHFEGVKTE